MIPRQPPRSPQLGFLYVPPFRVQGHSIAGEASAVQIPELDITFDIGECPRPILTSNFVAITHGHMDHTAQLAYYLSQRYFQGLGTGTVVCPPHLEQPIHQLMEAWVGIENQRTPYRVIPLEPGEELQIKNKTFLRAIPTAHTVPSAGYVVIERRTKLRSEFAGMSQEQIVAAKKAGKDITQSLDVPLVCYTGDTAWGPQFDRPDVLEAKILVTECTFTDPQDKKRAAVGKHLYIDDVVRLVQRSHADAIVLTHLSRRTNIPQARKLIEQALPEEERHRVHLLMDARTNRTRYEQQKAELGGEDLGEDDAIDRDER